MLKMWICDYCKDIKGLNQKEFIRHLKSNHLSKFNHNQNIQFQCNYGENGKCLNNNVLSEFLSEKEYEQHLLKTHLKNLRLIDSNNFSISNKECYENSQNYHTIVSQAVNSTTKWSPYHSVVNLPAVLNDPNNRQLDIFSKTWGESFEKAQISQCSHLISPNKDFFEKYITQIRSSLKYREAILKKINDNKNLEGCLVDSNQNFKIENVPKIFFQPDFNLNSKDIFSSVIPIFHTVVSSPTSLCAFTNYFGNSNNSTKTLSSFNGRPKSEKWLTDTAAVRMNDKLSHYLDIVEINIAKQVSKKSNAFFEAVATHDKVQDKLKCALKQISDVRSKLQSANETLTKSQIHIGLLEQKKVNLQLLSKQLRIVKTVHSTQAVIQTLLSSNDFCGALDLIAGTQSLMHYELLSSKDGSRISPILCLRHVNAQLVEMRKFVEKVVRQEFLNAVIHQLRLEENGGVSGDNGNEGGLPIVNGGNQYINNYYCHQLVPSLLAMIRIVLYGSPTMCANVDDFVQLYFDEAMEVLKTIVMSRTVQAFSSSCQLVLSQSSESIGGTGGTGINSSVAINCGNGSQSSEITGTVTMGSVDTLGDQMRALSHDHWMELINDISHDMLLLLDKVQSGSQTMTETILTHVDKSGTFSDNQQHVILPVHSEGNIMEQLRTTVISEIEALPGKIVESVQQKMVNLVRIRAKNRSLERLLPGQMVQLNKFLQNLSHDIKSRFVDTRFQISSDLLMSTCLQSFAHRLVNRFHNEHKEKLLLILDTDLWRAAEVPSQLQDLAKHISSQTGLSLLDRNCVSASDSVSQLSHQYLQLDHNRFTVVGAALMLFQMIVEYCQCAIDLHQIPHVSDVIFHNLIQLLETFNSRSYQLVLGAKARQLVELETISARNLALTARSLQLVLALTPKISIQFCNLTEKVKPNLLVHLTEVEQMYRNHIEDINSKLISLMEERIKTGMGSWTGRPPTPSAELRTVCQHLTKLHTAVCDVYQSTGETELFLKIHNVFKAQLRARMKDVDIVMDNGPKHGILKLELAFYMNQLTGFCGLKKFTDKFPDIWR